MEVDEIEEPAKEEVFEPFLHCQEDFEAFIWGKTSAPKTFSDSLKHISEDSYVFKTFNNEFETDNLFTPDNIDDIINGTLDIDKLLKVNETTNHHFKISSSLSYVPIQSALTKIEMRKCCNIYLDICANKKILGDQFEFYNSYKDIIESEQHQYLKIAEDSWHKNKFYERANFIKPEILEYTTKLWKERIQRLHWYPKLYIKAKDIPLIDDSERVSEFKFMLTLKSLGNSPCLPLPNLKSKKVNIYSELTDLDCENINSKEVKFSYKPVHATLLEKGYHPDVSKDEIAESLATKCDAQVVISESGFLKLFDVHKDSTTLSWDLPIVIKENENSKKKVVYIDKSLPQKDLTVVQRNNWFCKKIIQDTLSASIKKRTSDCSRVTELETFGIETDSPKSTRTANCRRLRSKNIPFSIKSEVSNDTNTSLDEELSDGTKRCTRRSSDCSGARENDITQLEKFGIETDSPKSIRTANRRRLRSTNSPFFIKSDDSNIDLHDTNTSLDEELSDGTKSSTSFNQSFGIKLEKKSSWEEDSDADCNTGDELVIDIGEEIQPNISKEKLPKTGKSLPKQANKLETMIVESPKKLKDSSPPQKTEYNLWCLKCESSSVLLKSNLKDVKIMIRCKYASTTTNKLGVANQVISPKLEYQPHFGAEVLSLNEISKEWCRVLIRPDSQLLRVRVDPLTGDVIMLEKKNLHELTLDARRLYSIEPNQRLTAIHTILDQLINQPPGKYLLSRNVKNGLFATLYKEDERNGTYNTMINYVNVQYDKVNMSHHNYLPIDKMVFTPAFLVSKRIPAMFYPTKSKKLESNLGKFEVEDKEDSFISLRSQKRRKAVSKKKKNAKKTNNSDKYTDSDHY